MTSSRPKQLTVPAHALRVGDVDVKVVTDLSAPLNQRVVRKTISDVVPFVGPSGSTNSVTVYYEDGSKMTYSPTAGVAIERTEKTLGEMTPAERQAAVKRAVAKFQQELDVTSTEIAKALTELNEEN